VALAATITNTGSCLEGYIWTLEQTSTGPPTATNLPQSGGVSIAPSQQISLSLTVNLAEDSTGGPLDLLFTVESESDGTCGPVQTGGCSTTAVINVCAVDLEIPGVAENDEANPGGFLCLNDDDDDNNGTADKDDTPPTVGEDDLLPIMLTIDSCESGGVVTLKAEAGASKIKAYLNADRTNEVTLPATWTDPNFPPIIYIEGIMASDAPRDVRLKLRYTQPNGTLCMDSVKLTVVAVTDVNVHSSDSETYKVASVLPPQQFPLLHFVTARKQNDVVLQASITPDVQEVRDQISWSTTAQGITITSPAIGNDKRTAKFSSDFSTGRKIPIAINIGPMISSCEDIIAWVVSADMAGTVSSPPTLVPISDYRSSLRSGTKVFAQITAHATIQPPEIVSDDTNKDIPDLKGSNLFPDLTGTNSCGKALKNGVKARWDISRRVQVRTQSQPAGLQLHCRQQPRDYPSDPVEGNDDISTKDESDNPYGMIGILLSDDKPTSFGPNLGKLSNGNVGNTFNNWACFQEFARLQLGPDGSAVWYVISDPLKWRVHFKFKKLQVTEALWNTDTNGNGDKLDNVMESDPFVNEDLNGDGDLDDPVGYWDDDGSTSATDNADCGHS